MRIIIILTCLFSLFSATALLAHQGPEAQLEQINKEIKTNPKSQKLFIKRGSIYAHDGRYEEALKDFNHAKELGPPVLVAYELGVSFYHKGELKKARAYFDSFIKAFPIHAQSYEYRARVGRDSGDYKEALLDLDKFFKLTERPNPGIYISAAKMLVSLKDEGIASAIELLDSGMAKIGLIPQLQHYSITLELERNRPQNAIARLESLKKTVGGGPAWKVDMAKLLLRVKKTTEAEELLRDADSQLATLRVTKARKALREEIKKLVTTDST
jgi:predicted Zn-dependent protease